jgi:uncharacterized membrane protein YidH (DUF202 family)
VTRSTVACDLPDNGLQAERTALAWTRTSFAVLANGALLVLKDLRGEDGLLGLVPPSLAAAVALGIFLIGAGRQRRLGHRPLPPRIAARRTVRVVGLAVVALVIATAIALPV